MIVSGSKIINSITLTTHIVDDIEIINGKRLVFTTDMKCFPIEDVKNLKDETLKSECEKFNHNQIDDVQFLKSLYSIIDISEFPSIPYEKKSYITLFWDKIIGTIW
jgi:hypothetical protein